MFILIVVLVFLGPAPIVGDTKQGYTALSFGRTTGDYIIPFRPDNMSPFVNSFTLCSWMKSLHSATEPIVFHYHDGPVHDEIIVGSNGRFNYVVNKNLDLRGKFPGANVWFHYCLSWATGGTTRVYINGVEVGNASASTSGLSLSGYISLGKQVQTYEISSYVFGGELYKLNMFSEQLTSSQIREMAISGMCSSVEEKYETRELKWEEILTKERHGNVREFELRRECLCISELTMLQKTLQNTETRLNSSDSSLQEVSTSLERTRSELTEIRTQLNETQRELKEKENRLQESRNEVQEKENMLQESETEFNRTKQKLEEVSSTFNGTLLELAQIRAQLNETQTDLEEKETRLHETEAKLEQKDTMLQESRNEVQKKENRLLESETEGKRTKKELQEVSITLNGTLSELKDTRAQLNEAQAELEEKDARLLDTQKELKLQDSRLQETVPECSSKLTEAEIELKLTKKTLRNTNRRLNRELDRRERKCGTV